MKHHWNIRRQPEMIPNAARRWDQAYQLLLTRSQLLPLAMELPLNTKEEINESRDLRAGIDPS